MFIYYIILETLEDLKAAADENMPRYPCRVKGFDMNSEIGRVIQA